ncbi:MAG: UDP-N-acetylglucosamine 1-carboxyvinyltransferase, partial [Clostridia bacterium]|nr:UDP-N-acetylglucosamine 1-carboxyvinyltransferase [Clostridia bacterium]
FKESGCNVIPEGKTIRLKSEGRLKRVPTIRTLVYPGFPTDAGPILISMLTVASGTTVFVENIFENRYKYTEELKRLGAKIKTEGKVAVVEGVDRLSAACCECTDLRGGAALVIAALKAEGTTEIDKIQHILRGYDDIAGHLSHLGAEVYIK